MVNLSGGIKQTKIQKLRSKGNAVFDWVVVVLGLWIIGGVHLGAPQFQDRDILGTLACCAVLRIYCIGCRPTDELHPKPVKRGPLAGGNAGWS
jgi:hypothetical protein